MTETIPTLTATDLTPWENRGGLVYKRDDFCRNEYGVNGSKFRACRHMMVNAMVEGYEHVVSAQAMASPQSAICATLARELGMRCTIVVGASKPETAVKHPNIALALRAGAELDTGCKVAYNGTLQPYAKNLSLRLGAWQLPYAISMPGASTPEELRAFLEVGGRQVENLPPDLQTLVIPFGSGNSAAGVLYGLSRYLPAFSALRRVVLVGIGPDRSAWLRERLERVGAQEVFNEFQVDHMPLHPWFAEYADRMPETQDGIEFHPVYEGKIVRWANIAKPDWWTRRDETTGFWVIGGEMNA